MVRLGPVEKGVPIPPRGTGKSSLKLEELGIGDSRVVHDSTINKVSARVSDHALRHGRRYTVRSEADGVVRVWRTA